MVLCLPARGVIMTQESQLHTRALLLHVYILGRLVLATIALQGCCIDAAGHLPRFATVGKTCCAVGGCGSVQVYLAACYRSSTVK